MTSWGHLIPLVCSRGLSHLHMLQVAQKNEAVIFALQLIVPLFFECQESLINNEHFQSILVGLLNADRGLINAGKSLVIYQQSKVVESLGNMIEYQICNFLWFKQSSPRFIVRIWLNSLVSVPNWNRDYNVTYLMDVIVRAAFFHADALDVINEGLKELLQVRKKN